MDDTAVTESKIPPTSRSRQSTSKPCEGSQVQVHAHAEDKHQQKQKQEPLPQDTQGTDASRPDRVTDDRHLTSHGKHHNNHNHIHTHESIDINTNHFFSTTHNLNLPENKSTTINHTTTNDSNNDYNDSHSNTKVDSHDGGDTNMTVARTEMINSTKTTRSTSGQREAPLVRKNIPSILSSSPTSSSTLPSSSPLSTTSTLATVSSCTTLQSTPTLSSKQPNISQLPVGVQNLHPITHDHIQKVAVNNHTIPSIGVPPAGHLKMSKPTRTTRRPKAMSLSPLRTPFTAPSWVLPPISPFADLGIKLDPRRSSGGAPSSTPDARTTFSNRVKKDNKDGNKDGNTSANNSNNNPPVTHHLPNIFDLIQDNEDESFILWDTPSQSSRLLSNTSRQYQSSTISTTTQAQSNIPSSVSASTLASDSTVKRWSGGDSKGKDKSKDALEPVTSPASPPENRVIMAATVEKLIERLTSDIDYTFLTDFFLVYRLFITPFSLLKLLMARFQWALANDSSQKHIVRIRTFVTLRHWILSFYKYDFVASKGVLHKALNKYLKSLHQHPVVATSTLDQRIVRDLRRHLQAQKKMSRTIPSPQEFLGCHCDHVHSGYSAIDNQSSSREGDCGHICSPSQGDEHRINSDAASADESEGEDLSDDEEGSIRTTRISSEGDVPQSQRTNTNSKKAGTPNTFHPTTQPSSKHGLPSPAGSTSWFSKGKGRRTPATQRSNSTNDYFGPAAFSHTTHEDQKNQSADSSQTSGDYSTSSRRSRRSRTQPSHSQLMSPLDPGRRLPLPTPDSLRSVEPYMNPPPRSITGSEKGSVWSHCLSSTMEQFSKVKRAIMSGSSHRNSRFLDSGSSIVLAGAAATETYRRKASKSAKSPRLWPMHRSRTGDIEDLRSAALSDDDPVVYASPAPSRSSSSAHLPDTPQEDHPVATASQEVLEEKTKHGFVKKSDHVSDASTASTNPPLVKRRLGRSQTTEEKESRSSWLSFSSTPASMFASIFTPGHSESKSAKNIRGRIAQGRSGSLDSASTTPAMQPPFLQTQPSLSFLNKPKRTKPSPLSHSTTSRKSMEDVIAVHVLKPQRSLRSLRKKNTREVLTERRWTVSKDDSISDLCDSQTEKLYHIHQEPSDSVLPSATVQSPLEEDAALSREIVASPQEPVPHHMRETLSHVVEQEKSFQELPTQPESRRTSIHTSVCSTPIVAAKKATRRVISHVHSHSHPLVITPLEPTKDHAPSSAASQPSTPVRPLLSKQMRSSSDPHLLTMAAFAATTSPTDRDILALAVNNARRHLTPSRPHPILTIRQFRTESRQHSRQHSPVHSRFFQDQDLEVDAYGVPVLRPILPPPFVSMVLMYRSEMIAQQLCLIERELLLRVQWYELVDAGWTKKKQQQEQKEQQERQEEVQVKEERQEQENESEKAPPVEEVEQVIDLVSDEKPEDASHRASLESCSGDVEDVKVSLRKKRYSSESRGRRSSRVHTPIPKEVDENSPNIKQLVDRFNMTCEWVTAEILRSTDDDLRVKVVEKFIRIAHTCYNHSNFSSLTQIMLGLQHHTVSRLSRTWERVQPEESKVMQELTDFTAPFHNFKHIRNAMKAVADEWGGPGGAIMGDSQPLATGQYPTLSTGAPTPPLETVNTGRRFDHGMSGSGSGTGFFSKRPTSSHGQDESVTGWPYPQASSTTNAGPTTTTASSSGFLLDDRNHIQQQQQGGSIPFLGIYLSDLVYNTELPSYVEPRALPKNQETAQALSEAMASTMLQHLPTPSSSLGSLKVIKNETEQLPSFASTLSTEEPMTTTEPLTEANALANKIMLVNMHKHRTTATIIKRILTFQTLAERYPFQLERDVFDWLKAMERAEDPDDFDRMSALCEERIRP